MHSSMAWQLSERVSKQGRHNIIAESIITMIIISLYYMLAYLNHLFLAHEEVQRLMPLIGVVEN